MAYTPATAVEIDKKLRDDFRRRLKDFGISAETTDPVLAVLFRTFAGQLEALYSETERIRLALLDELIGGLGLERRTARPAQTVVRFLLDSGAEWIEAGTELIGGAQSGERLTFSTDANISVSPASIALGATYQEGALRLMQGVEMPEALQNARPSLEPVKVNLGPNPAVFLAIDNLPPQHLGRHGFFFELSPDAESIRQALLTETWCLAGAEGDLGAQGILRPRRQNAGARALEWLIGEEAAAPEAPSEEIEVPPLPDGFYTGRLFSFPEVPPSRRFLCRIPKGMDTAFSRIFGRAASQLFDRPRAWLRIAMPRRVADLHTGITSIWPHAVGASNVECFNETVRFEEHGASIPVSREGGTSKFLVAPLSVFGEAKSAYYPEFQPSPDPGAGRYSIHNGRIELRATRHSDNHYDSYANLRLWVTGGALGNGVGPGKVQAFLKRAGSPALRISNPTSAAGGADEEGLDQARARFAAALLSRDRVVTRADLLGVVRAFDRRILNADVAMGLERTGRGLQRVQRVRCVLDRNGFLDPEREGRVLAEELTGHLKDRFLYDIELALELEWQ